MADVHERLRDFWDEDAETYDRSPSHALTDPTEAAAWRAALLRHLPARGASVLDVGAGTGAISLLAAELGYRVTALDLSPGMLARARQKADARGLEIETVVAPNTEPPPGPFDAVIERHVLWTTPDPATALASWRRSAPQGRLVVFEGLFSRDALSSRVRSRVADAARALLRVPEDHHGGYDPDLLASLPLARGTSVAALAALIAEAGWRALRFERLRDVEWARNLASPWPLGPLERVPQFAIAADA